MKAIVTAIFILVLSGAAAFAQEGQKRAPSRPVTVDIAGHQQEIQAERDRKLEAARQQRKNRR